ncbi:MAG: PspC domain-containing protein [Patescibacteria group bacterium]|nr:PspC domain-containing protein [Patescibacteria group bacterium]
MNEITRIHLGRQPFTASIKAHKALEAYISAIQNQVDDKDVIEEVELRMAELLTERGLSGDKVILEQDVDYLKQQLGDPKDFSDTNSDESTQTDNLPATKQLFRDPEHGMVAGVAAGLAAYFGVDVLLIRIIFVIGALTGGWGILIYIAIWLLVPPAKSGSDWLRMRGESVTLSNLKTVVERADAKGAAVRAGNTVAPLFYKLSRIALRLIGIVLIIGSLGVLFGLVATRIYMAAHHGQLFQENLFPVGTTEHLLADLVFGLAGIVAVFGILCGLTVFKRRWPIPGWVTGIIAALFLIGMATAGALSVDSAHSVRDRYLSRSHTISRTVEPFQDVTIVGKDVDYRWEYADNYAVSFHYFDNPDISKIKTTISNNLLQIDTTNYDRDRDCSMLCIFPAYNLLITVKGPRPLSTDVPAKQAIPEMPSAPNRF